jgi:chromate transport protein ChrA
MSTDPSSAIVPGRSATLLSSAGRRAGGLMPALPAVALVLLPKCPMCLMAWFGLMGAFDLSPWVTRLWGMPLSLALLGIAMAVLLMRARRCHDWRAAALGLAGSIFIFSGKFLLETPVLLYGGLIILALATRWSGRLRPNQGRLSQPGLPTLPMSECACHVHGTDNAKVLPQA